MYRDCEGIMCFLVGLGILRILLANSQKGISNSGGRPVIPPGSAVLPIRVP